MRTLAIIVAVMLLVAGTAFGNIYRVRNDHDSGLYSFRWAIEQANTHIGRDKVLFRPAMAGKVILLATPLPNLTDNRTIIDGDIDGDGDPDVAVNGKSLAAGNGLTMSGNYCTVSGLAVTNFPGVGIVVENAVACRVLGCHVGVDLAGAARRPNGGGDILIHDGTSCRVGGAAAGQRNVIAGGDGVVGSAGIRLAGADDTLVVNNYIGVARDGKTAFGGKSTGVDMTLGSGDPATRNTVGGSRPAGEGNVFGGLNYGVKITTGQDNVVAGNNFGLAADGDTALPVSAACIVARGASQRTLIGGASPDARNVFAGNAQAAVGLVDSGTQDNKVQGNYFGTNVAGDKQRKLAAGVVVELGAGRQIVGGNTAATGNYFALKSTQKMYGVYLDRAGEDSLIRYNRFGIRPDGTTAPNYDTAVYIRDVRADVADNKIANASVGLMVLEASGRARILRNLFRGCYIAVDIGPAAWAMLGNLGNPTAADDGGNKFKPSNTWAIDNESTRLIKAEGNDFGTTSRAAINAKVRDRRDEATRGRVDYSPLIGGVLPTGDTAPLLAVTGATAVPARAGAAELTFSLSAPGDVTVTILNIAGRPVATVARDLAADRGLIRMVWTGRTQGGTLAPAGLYVVRVAARSAAGQQAQAICSLQLER